MDGPHKSNSCTLLLLVVDTNEHVSGMGCRDFTLSTCMTFRKTTRESYKGNKLPTWTKPVMIGYSTSISLTLIVTLCHFPSRT